MAFCTTCGYELERNDAYCAKCGQSARFREEVPPSEGWRGTRISQDLQEAKNRLITGIDRIYTLTKRTAKLTTQNELDSIAEVAAIDSLDLRERCEVCHGLSPDLTGYRFGLARVLSTERDWLEVGTSVAMSAVTLPLFGMARLALQGKRSQTMRVLILHLVVCKMCDADGSRGLLPFPRKSHYKLHPAYAIAAAVGYTKTLHPQELSALSPVGSDDTQASE